MAPIEPTPAELQRHIAALEARVERERREVLDEIRRGFVDLGARIEAQNTHAVPREVYEADQRRLDVEIQDVADEVKATRRLLVTSFLAVIAIATLLQLLLPSGG